ncbi:putative ribonuclease H-like domain-containing protein, partial [Tanacetum coccineum]
MTGNKYYLTEYEDHDGGFVSFGDSKGRLSGKVLSSDFKLPDESQVLLRVPRQDNIYSVDLKSVVPTNGLTCLVAKATLDESMLWHRRLGHVNFKTINKLVKDNLVRDNGVAKRINRTLIEAARTMLAKSKLPIIFWAKAVNTACYVQNKVIIVKPHNKTPYDLFRGRTLALSFMIPFWCHVSILNTLDHLGKFYGKSDDGFFVGYSLTSKDFRVYNKRTRRVEENLHIRFLEDKLIVVGDGPKWLFNLDSLTKSMNYVPVIVGTNSNDFAGSEVSNGEGSTSKEASTSQEYTVMPMWKDSSLFDSPSINISHDEPESSSAAEKRDDEGISKATKVDNQERPKSSSLNINTVGLSINTTNPNPRTGSLNINIVSPTVITTRSNYPQSVSNILSLRDNVSPEASNADLFGEETEIDMSNLNASYQIPTTPTTRIHKDHSLDQVIGDIQSRVQTRGMTKTANEQGLLSAVYKRKPHEDLNTSMQEELLQFKLQKVWVLMDIPKGKRAIARIEAIRLFLAYASYMGFMVYQMDVKSAFLYGQIEDPDHPDKVYKVVKALYRLHQAPRA